VYGLRGCNAVSSEENPKKRVDASWLLSWLTLRYWRWRRYVPPKRRDLSGLHSITTKRLYASNIPKTILKLFWHSFPVFQVVILNDVSASKFLMHFLPLL
jgi:hypothetical protein